MLLLMVLLFVAVLLVALIWAGEVPDDTQPDLLFRSVDGIEWSLAQRNASCTEPEKLFCGGFRKGMPLFFDMRSTPPQAAEVCAWGQQHARVAAVSASLSGVYADPKTDVALVRRYFGEAPTDMSMRAVPHRYPEAAKRSTLARWAERLAGAHCEESLRGVGWGSAVEASIGAEVSTAIGRRAVVWPALAEGAAELSFRALTRAPDGVALPAVLAGPGSTKSMDMLFGRTAAWLGETEAQKLHDAAGDKSTFFFAYGQALCGTDRVGEVARVQGYEAWCENAKS